MTDGIIISLITSAAAIIVVLITNHKTNTKVDNYHKEVNSKMDAALKAAEALGYAKGMAAKNKNK